MATKKYDYETLYTHNSSGIRGVSYDKAKRKWEVKIQKNRQRVRVGFFDSIKDAMLAREAYLSQGQETA